MQKKKKKKRRKDEVWLSRRWSGSAGLAALVRNAYWPQQPSTIRFSTPLEVAAPEPVSFMKLGASSNVWWSEAFGTTGLWASAGGVRVQPPSLAVGLKGAQGCIQRCAAACLILVFVIGVVVYVGVGLGLARVDALVCAVSLLTAQVPVAEACEV